MTEEREIISHCEGCSKPLYDGDNFHTMQQAADKLRVRAEAAEAEVKRLTEENEALTQLMLTADRFNVGEIDGCPVHVVTRGPNQWAVSDGSFVLNDSSTWELEPMPSSRSDAFIARTRFTFADAIRLARATLNSREKVDG